MRKVPSISGYGPPNSYAISRTLVHHMITARTSPIFALQMIKDRPFNLKGGGYGFLFGSEFFFRTTQELEYFFFLSRKARIFFPESNIRLYDKNSESYFFSSTTIRIFFSATLGIRIFFLEKKQINDRVNTHP